MPLTGISSRPQTALSAFTYRELLSQQRLLERAARRGHDARAMLARIEAELEARRARSLARFAADTPDVD